MKYRPDIDGLRALAVLAVVFYHAGITCSGGYVGVDVFFVISGYLITSLILRDLRSGTFSIVDFWERRLRRILPALIFCVGITLIAGWFLLIPDDLESLGKSAVAQSLCLANVFFWRTTNYFGGENLEKPLLHTWSLAVEEQFYIILPLLLLFFFRKRVFEKHRLLPVLLGIIAILSLGLSMWGVRLQPYATFFLLPTRAWELLIGSLLVFIPSSHLRKPVLLEGASWLGLALILGPIFCYDETTVFPGLAALWPCLGAALIIWTNAAHESDPNAPTQRTTVGRILSLPPLRFVGLISYSLYLVHWPLLVFGNYWRTQELTEPTRWLLLAACFPIAIASWYFVETPFRRRRFCKTRRQVFTCSAVSIVLSAALGLSLTVGKGYPQRLSPEARELISFLDTDEEVRKAFRKAPDFEDFEQLKNGNLGVIGFSDANSREDFILIGDSHAQFATPLFHRLASSNGVSGRVITHIGTPPITNWDSKYKLTNFEPQSLFNASLKYVREHQIRKVFMMAFWSQYQERGGAEDLKKSLIMSIEKFEDAGAKVYLMVDNPTYDNSVSRILLRQSFFNFDLPPVNPLSSRELQLRQSAVFAAASSLRSCLLLDPTTQFLEDGSDTFMIAKDAKPLYRDGDHLTQFGVETVWAPILSPIFEKMNSKRHDNSNE